MLRPMTPVLLALALVVLAFPATSQAKLFERLAAKNGGPTPVQKPTQAPTQAPIQAPIQSPVQAGKMVCDTPCIKYNSHRLFHCKFDRCDTSTIVLSVTDPCTYCTYGVPVCIPNCCGGAPTVCSHPGICGRDVIEYEWCCGYRVKVVFDKCGDITVHTYGL